MRLKYCIFLAFSIYIHTCKCFSSKPSILNIKCNDYLNSINNINVDNSKIVQNFKDILKFKNGHHTMNYNELIYQNTKKNLKEILIQNNENIIYIKLNDNTVYKYYNAKKIDIIGLLNLIFFYYNF